MHNSPNSVARNTENAYFLMHSSLSDLLQHIYSRQLRRQLARKYNLHRNPGMNLGVTHLLPHIHQQDL
jgi:hypothetical protein